MFALAVLLMVIVSSTVLSYLVYKSNPSSASHRLFAVFGLSIVFWSIVMYQSLHFDDLGITLFYIRLSMLAGTILAVSALLFAQTFPNEKMHVPLWGKLFLSVMTPLTMVVSMSNYMFTEVQIVDGNIEPEPGIGIILFVITAVGSVIATGFILIRKFLRAKSLEKTQYFFMIVGILLMFLLLITTNFVTVVLWKDSSLIFLAPLYPLIFLGSTAYAVFRHKLLDIRMVLVRAISYFVTIITLSGVLALLLLISTSLFVNVSFNLNQMIWFIGFSLLFVNFYQPLKRLFEQYTEQFFYRRTYDFSSVLHDLGKDISSSIILDKLISKVAVRLKESLKISTMKVVFFDDELNKIAGGSQYTQLEGVRSELLMKFFRILFQDQKSVVFVDEVENREIRKFLHTIQMDVVMPLFLNRKLIGACLFGPKSSGETYSLRDIDLFRIIAPQLAIGIQNALSYEEIRRFNVTLQEEIQEATTELRQANTKLSHSNKELKQLDKLKDEFVSIASHELRTPMTAIKGYLWLALHKSPKPLPAQVQKNLQIAYDSNERLSKLVENMLTISRIEGNRFELELVEFDVRELLQEIHDELAIRAKEKKIKLQIDVPEESLFVQADKEKIRECYINILGNALKFTPESGSITMTAFEKKKEVFVEIKDTGPGISEQDKKKLFQKFSRLDHSYNKTKESGTGLGLFITKQIIDLHHGSIAVRSTLGKGTTFTITLPVAVERNS